MRKLSTSKIIKQIGFELGFQQIGITDARLDAQHANYRQWIARNYHGEMGYMARNIEKRLHPAELVPDTLSVICVRLDYLVEEQQDPLQLLDHDAGTIFWEEAFSSAEQLSWYIVDAMPWLLPQHIRYVGQECSTLKRAIEEGACYEQG